MNNPRCMHAMHVACVLSKALITGERTLGLIRFFLYYRILKKIIRYSIFRQYWSYMSKNIDDNHISPGSLLITTTIITCLYSRLCWWSTGKGCCSSGPVGQLRPTWSPECCRRRQPFPRRWHLQYEFIANTLWIPYSLWS